ncbi:MAG: glycosyltransferase family 2 protein [Flavobacterium sp.]
MFSIIIPLYNKENTIENTVKSVLNQSFKNFELIIINDGSTDHSLEKILKFKDFRIKIKSTENKGVSQARNLGIEKATQPYIAFLDADDIWKNNHLEVLKNLILDYPNAGLYATKYKFIYDNGHQIIPFFIDITKDFRGTVPNFFKSSAVYRIAWTSCVCVPKNILDIIGIFDEEITLGAGEDTDLWTRIAIKYPVAIDSKITSIYNFEGENHLSNEKIEKKKYAKYDKLYAEEKENIWLKKFLDRERAEFALKHKRIKKYELFQFYYNHLSLKNLNWKIIVLLHLPSFLLNILYKFKHKMGFFVKYFDLYR